MADEYDYQLWIYQCQKIIRQAQIKKKIRRKRIICALLCNELVIQRSKKKYTPKKFWIHPLFKLRREHGFFEAVFPTLSSYSEKIENYIRMIAIIIIVDVMIRIFFQTTVILIIFTDCLAHTTSENNFHFLNIKIIDYFFHIKNNLTKFYPNIFPTFIVSILNNVLLTSTKSSNSAIAFAF
ncbi:hypothetical protein KQX54_011278 [Cotesia glomerata]|uniref:Uncharacterized protein n=1 Tax=Cotesia glomerata TaxID=32391 RepID=A0AAV7HZK2_COTGL|nr:hypothetical protein KQX54_011278 [Cotesia glomerata]